VDVFPFEQEIGQNTNDNTVLFVDIGSGLESQSILVRDRFPNLKGRAIIQDQQHVIDAWSANAKPAIESQAYNFFIPQPVRGKSFNLFPSCVHTYQAN
jgi:hypothetical protein